MKKNGFTNFQNILIDQVKDKIDTEHLNFEAACARVGEIYAIKPLYVKYIYTSFKEAEIMLK